MPEAIDIVNVFRHWQYLSGIVDEAIASDAKTVWVNWECMTGLAALKSLDAEINVAMNSYIKIE